jgi:hypothetical protein
LIELARWPSRGNRRKLDELWLRRLEHEGLSEFTAGFPERPGPEMWKAVDQFNEGRFWECHETLEDVWRATPYPLRHYYHGIIKVAVGFHHLSRHNRKGATSKLSEGLRFLQVFTPSFYGLDIDLLLSETSQWMRRIQGTATVNWADLDRLPTPRIRPPAKGPRSGART